MGFSAVILEATTELTERVSDAETGMFRALRDHWARAFSRPLRATSGR